MSAEDVTHGDLFANRVVLHALAFYAILYGNLLVEHASLSELDVKIVLLFMHL